MTELARDDLARLREEHPGWNFESLWITANSGPDRRLILASRNGVILTAWTAAELAEVIRQGRTCEPGRGERAAP